MSELSPAAQAVLDAATPALNNLDACGFNHQRYDRKALAAALRAAVDQAIPLTNTPWGSTLVPVLTSWESRDRLLAIATELENHAN